MMTSSELSTIKKAEADAQAARAHACRVRDAAAAVEEAEQQARDAELRLQRARELPEQRKAREQAEAERREREKEIAQLSEAVAAFEDKGAAKLLRRIAAAEQDMREAIADFARRCDERNASVQRIRELAQQNGAEPPALSLWRVENMQIMSSRAVRECRNDDATRTKAKSAARLLCQDGTAAWLERSPAAR